MERYPSIGSSLRSLYIVGIIVLIIIYTALADFTMHYVEDSSNGERLKLNAPYFFKHYAISKQGYRKITPLTTIYENYNALPSVLKEAIPEGWTGYKSIHLAEYGKHELGIYGSIVNNDTAMYAVEKVTQIEIDNTKILFFLIIIGSVGLITLIFISYLSIRTANQISKPFIDIAAQLTTGKVDNAFTKLKSNNDKYFESNLILSSINQYRQDIESLMERE